MLLENRAKGGKYGVFLRDLEWFNIEMNVNIKPVDTDQGHNVDALKRIDCGTTSVGRDEGEFPVKRSSG